MELRDFTRCGQCPVFTLLFRIPSLITSYCGTGFKMQPTMRVPNAKRQEGVCKKGGRIHPTRGHLRLVDSRLFSWGWQERNAVHKSLQECRFISSPPPFPLLSTRPCSAALHASRVKTNEPRDTPAALKEVSHSQLDPPSLHTHTHAGW